MAWQDVPSFTKEQVSALQDEAVAAGDYAMAAICAAAMEGDPAAESEVARVLRDAAAQRDKEHAYKIAFVVESTGDWDVVESFTALDDDAANAYAKQHYAGRDWYVLNSTGRNINGGVDG